MPAAKFHIIGDASPWLRTRVQEEMNQLSLTGTTIAAGKKTTAVMVEGDREKIIELRENLRKQCPEHLLYTRIEYGEEQPADELKPDEDITTILKGIQKQLDEINIKLDAIVENRPIGKTAIDGQNGSVSDFFNM